uniref:Uncharacterized protein n=1 Tax=uncultured bacterium Contigcl_1539 TaxID=1393650 RepID=W0FS94_9BACT|nr:hypothetical protein [uncultured bacterium Contigcl_1539]
MEQQGKKEPEKQAFENIGVELRERIVRVANDEPLTVLLKTEKHKGARALARYILAEYRQQFGTELKIRERSLACEIYWHYYCWDKAVNFEQRHGKKKFTSWLIRHIDVSDCGEQKEDNNRFVWDILSIVF